MVHISIQKKIMNQNIFADNQAFIANNQGIFVPLKG